MTDKLLEANVKAAGMLGDSVLGGDGKVYVRSGEYSNQFKGKLGHYNQHFSITNPSDRDAVVQMLGKEHRLTLSYCISEDAWEVMQSHSTIYPRLPFFTKYQDAVVAAVLAV